MIARSSLLLTVLFAVCIGFIHARPYDDHDLSAFLRPPEGCPAPCFMGIRPGETSVGAAVALLQDHEWVGEVTVYHNRSGQIYLIQWSWIGSQPAVIDSSKLAHLYARDNIVLTMTTPTNIPFADIWLTLGSPDRGSMGAPGRTVFVQNLGYFNRSVGVQSMISCPFSLQDMLQAPVELSFIGDMHGRFGDATFHPSDWRNARPCGR